MSLTTSLFRNATDIKTFQAGEVIFERGNEGKVAYAVISGEVELLVGDEIVETLVEGSVFGEMALIDHLPRSATARAKTDCSVAPIDTRRFEWLVQQTPYFATLVMQTMAERLRRMNERI